MNVDRAKQQFLETTANHTMQVLQDDGVHRHLSFTNGGSSIYRFDLITWPGHLCITGDVETYVFQREHDMFTFFRSSNEYRINPRYWSEKIQNAGDSKCERHSEAKFKANINEWVSEWEFDDEELKAEVLRAVQDNILDYAGDETLAYHAVAEFDDYYDQGYHFQDFWEVSSSEYHFGYLWSCFAIVHGIELYNAQQQAAA